MSSDAKFSFSERFNSERITSFYEDCLMNGDDSGNRNGWKDSSAQQIRFNRIINAVLPLGPLSICDVGCGTGDFLHALRNNGFSGDYIGLDLSDQMISVARKNYINDQNSEFFVSSSCMSADVLIASGIFNVKGDADDREWVEYVYNVINNMWVNSRKAISFNVLSQKSDVDARKPNLFYADPLNFFSYLSSNFTSALIFDHSYGQFDMTITLIRGNK